MGAGATIALSVGLGIIFGGMFVTIIYGLISMRREE